MSKNNLHLYSIMALDMEHVDEICEDIRQQYESGVTSCALFCMTLVPEGNPPVNKAKIMCEQYDLFREKLSSMGVPSGVLVQASIGHGWVLSEMFPYQRYVNLMDGEEVNVVCPYDEGFKQYIYDALRTITSHKPDCIMIDDDFRLIFREGGGCTCPLHMKRFNELAGTQMTREELLASIQSRTEEGKKHEQILIETQREALVETAKVMRAGIDSIDPKMPGSYCCVSNNAEFAAEIAPILAGEGNPVVVRINNGNYTAAGARFFSKVFFRGAAQIAKLKDTVDVILAEPDTCPQNRYSTGAMSLHTHFTGTILEGASGAKHWITRLSSYEPESGKAFRKILSKNRGFYEELAAIVPELKWYGFRMPVYKEPHLKLGETWVNEADCGWGTCVLERFGLPMYFSADQGGVLCLEGDLDEKLTDEEMLEALKGSVMLASDSAQNLIKRGFGEYLGVDVQEWTGSQASYEHLYVNGINTEYQKKIKALVPASKDTIVDSMVYHSVCGANIEELFPGATIYKNKLGGTVFVFCGTPKTEYSITEAFAFLNYSRKLQITRMLEMAGQCPVYYPNDEEVYLKAADMKDGSLFCAIFNIGLDPIEQVELVCKKDISKIEKLMPDGSRKEVSYQVADGKYILETSANTLDPAILFLS